CRAASRWRSSAEAAARGEPRRTQGMLTVAVLSLALGQASAPTLTPEDVARGRAVEKYGGQRVVFRGWLHVIRQDEKRKFYVHAVKAVCEGRGPAARVHAPYREVVVSVCFAQDLAARREQHRRALRAGERITVAVEGKVVQYPLGWRLEEARLLSAVQGPRGK